MPSVLRQPRCPLLALRQLIPAAVVRDRTGSQLAALNQDDKRTMFPRCRFYGASNLAVQAIRDRARRSFHLAMHRTRIPSVGSIVGCLRLVTPAAAVTAFAA